MIQPSKKVLKKQYGILSPEEIPEEIRALRKEID